jgi:4-hydroxy-3-methylbut-2-en-1-yl diphosphate synthase IspG/GcpE
VCSSDLGGSKHLGKLLQHAVGATARTSIEDSHSNELFVLKIMCE